MRLGEMIKEYREARGLSQRAFARKCGLSNGQIAFLERGIWNSGKPFEPTFDTLRKVARAMGTYPEYLMETADEFKISLRRRDTTDDDLGTLLFGDDGVISREEFDERRRENQELMKHLETPSAPDLPLNWKDLYFELSDAQKNVLWKTTVDHFTVRDRVVSIAFETARVLAERMAILAEETETAAD